MIQEYGRGPIANTAIEHESCVRVIKSHQQPIVDASFSPDGDAIATASLDGTVKFFVIYMHEDSST